MSNIVITIAELTDIIQSYMDDLDDAVKRLHVQIELAQETGILDDVAATWMTEQSQTIIGHGQRMMEHFGNLDPEANPKNHRRLAFRSERLLEEAVILWRTTVNTTHSGVVRNGNEMLRWAGRINAAIDTFTHAPR